MERGTIRHPFLVFVLPYLTLGLYAIYWFFVTCSDINRGLGRKVFNPLVEFVLIICTFGLWSFWWAWRASEAVAEVEASWGLRPKFEPVLLFILYVLGFGHIAMQYSLNQAWRFGSPRTARLDYQHNPAFHQGFDGSLDSVMGYPTQPHDSHHHQPPASHHRPPASDHQHRGPHHRPHDDDRGPSW